MGYHPKATRKLHNKITNKNLFLSSLSTFQLRAYQLSAVRFWAFPIHAVSGSFFSISDCTIERFKPILPIHIYGADMRFYFTFKENKVKKNFNLDT